MRLLSPRPAHLTPLVDSSSPSLSWDPLPSAVHDLILRSQSLAHAKQAHAFAAASGILRRHLPSAAALILTYSTHGDPAASARLFDYSPLRYRGAFLWNALVRSLSSAAGLHDAALGVYNRMLRCGFRPDERTYPFILTSAAAAAADRKGRELHASVVKVGFLDDVFVGNTLLSFYGAVGDLFSARRVFDEMANRDTISWNSMISVFSANNLHLESMIWFLELKRSGLLVNSVSLISALPACAAIQDKAFGMSLHGCAIKVGLDSVLTVSNAFVDMYGKCGNSEYSLQLFWTMQERNDVSWNTIIGSLVHAGHYEHALDMFRDMLTNKIQPNAITVSSLLPGLVELGSFGMGRELHGYSIRTDMDSDIYVCNSLVDMYAKSGSLRKGSYIFYQMEKRNVVSWNAMIANLTQNGAESDAIKLIKEMQLNGELPNSVTFTNVIPACSRIASLKKGKEIHAQIIRKGSTHDLFVSNALIDMYAKCGKLNLAWNVFIVSERDQVSYNTLLVGYSESTDCSEALNIFMEMRLIGLEYDVVSFMGALSACGNLSAFKQGKEIHCLSIRKLLNNHLFVANSLLDLYMKCGRIDIGRKIFDRMPVKDVASWNSMIMGYGMHGELETAIELFDSMNDEPVEYDHVSYIAVLSACSHAGLVERGKKYLNQMLLQNIRPTQMHFACMVDLLGRAGLMKDATELITSMPFEADSNVWGALLGAARIHGNLEIGRWAAEHLFELKPEHCGYYILLANMYAEVGRWDEVDEIRALMKSRKLKKNPGCSWVGTGDKLDVFVKGDFLEYPEEVREAEEDFAHAEPG